MNIQDLIPKDKSDLAAVGNLSAYSFTEVESIIPELLTWLQDLHWPVAGKIFDYLETNRDSLTNEVINVIIDNDDIWKRNCLLLYSDAMKIDERLLEAIKRIAINPTVGEIEDDVQEIALEIIEKLKK